LIKVKYLPEGDSGNDKFAVGFDQQTARQGKACSLKDGF